MIDLIFHLSESPKKLAPIWDCPKTKIASIQTKTVAHEGNNGAMILAMPLPGRLTPMSNFFYIKYHWFCEQLNPDQIKILKVASYEQLADIFTKGL